MRSIDKVLAAASVAAVTAIPGGASARQVPKPSLASPLGVVVMDPLSKRLACACVKGYAQRDYELLARYLSIRLARPVRMFYAEDLAKAIASARETPIAAVVGKYSVVLADAAECHIPVRPVAALSTADGSTTITGWFVVRKADPARSLADLRGRRIFFGPKEDEEKYGAALAALDAAGIPRPSKVETRPGCTEAALSMLESKQKPAPAALISSYAATLIEGCGTVPKGTLRVVGKTAPVPFVTVFATSRLDGSTLAKLNKALADASRDPYLLQVMETKGFVPVATRAEAIRPERIAVPWPGWRGRERDGHVPWLPEKLPDKPKVLWRQPLSGGGMAGVAVSGEYVVVPGRDAADRQDVFRCFRADTGAPVWKVAYKTVGRFDYGNSPRATPLIVGRRVYLLGAFGNLTCVDLPTGSIVWQRDLASDFRTRPPTWGYCGSPLLAGDTLIVSPGAKTASVAGLNKDSGATVWMSPGPGASYSSFVDATLGGRRQAVGYDATSLGGWDEQTGARLWTLTPPVPGDFDIGTPVIVGPFVLVATERNATRLYGFASGGKIVPTPAATFLDLAPDTMTPVVSGARIVGDQGKLYCLDRTLKLIWSASDPAFKAHVSLIASDDRVLVTTYRGELLLIATGEKKYHLLSRVRVSPPEQPFYSHPALVGDLLYLRDATGISCLSLRE